MTPVIYALLAGQPLQTAAMVLLLVGEGWLIQRSIKQGEQLAELRATVTNHYAHRFAKLKDLLGIEWDEDSDE